MQKEKKIFFNKVLKMLRAKHFFETNRERFDKIDFPVVKKKIDETYERNFTIIDSYFMCSYLEHVNPNLEEDYALKKIQEMNQKYKDFPCKPQKYHKNKG
jgi:hypothetical protein